MQSFFVPAGGECREKKRRNKIVSKNNPSKPQQAEDGGFRQEISLFGGVSIIGGIMIGSGIFYLGSYVLQRSGMSPGLSLLVWIIGGLVSRLGGLCYADLGASKPKPGGSYVYLSEAFHPAVGFMGGFSSWLLGGEGPLQPSPSPFPKRFPA